ncbi:MAG: radical SAM protein [Holophaga sp.]|nr:radical SAM protein [Holophaga sp.]
MGALCPFNNQSGVDPEVCIRSMACRYIYCPRLGSISRTSVLAGGPAPDDGLLFLDNITIVVNSVCSLSCKLCTSYIPSYPADRRKNYPLERILMDIDQVFDAVDGIGSVSIMGGEPFLHPDIAAIALAVLAKKNCTGLISIASSGTARIKDKHLAGLDNPRLNVSFGNYLSAVQEPARKIWHDNVRLVEERGIPHTVGVDQPQWIVPSTLYDRGRTVEEMATKKGHCPSPPRMLHVKNGKLHPCDLANSVYSIGLADYPSDYVDIAQSTGRSALRQRIRAFLDAPFYHICGHCESTSAMALKGAEQGYQDFLTRPIDEA